MLPGSAVPAETQRWLNLLRTSQSFVLVEGDTAGDESLQRLDRIPSGIGMCWVSGTITTIAGQVYEAVHVVSTEDGGQLNQSFVWVDGWIQVADLARKLEMDDSLVFPIAYTLSVPLEDDRYLP